MQSESGCGQGWLDTSRPESWHGCLLPPLGPLLPPLHPPPDPDVSAETVQNHCGGGQASPAPWEVNPLRPKQPVGGGLGCWVLRRLLPAPWPRGPTGCSKLVGAEGGQGLGHLTDPGTSPTSVAVLPG